MNLRKNIFGNSYVCKPNDVLNTDLLFAQYGVEPTLLDKWQQILTMDKQSAINAIDEMIETLEKMR